MEDNGKKNMSFVEMISYHMKRIAEMFTKSSAGNDNEKIAEAGRTEEEQKQLLEMCEEIDNFHRYKKEMRESGHTPGEWLNNKIDTDLEALDSEITIEDKNEVKQFLIDETKKEIEENTDALSEEIDVVNDVIKEENAIEEKTEEGGKE